jgi:hypothetical protein
MWERFCPTAQRVCRDGYPGDTDILCSLWDSVNQECIITGGLLASLEFNRKALDPPPFLPPSGSQSQKRAATLVKEEIKDGHVFQFFEEKKLPKLPED